MEYNHVTSESIEQLKDIVGAKYVWTDRDKLIPYSQDEGSDVSLRRMPEAVVCRHRRKKRQLLYDLPTNGLFPLYPVVPVRALKVAQSSKTGWNHRQCRTNESYPRSQ